MTAATKGRDALWERWVSGLLDEQAAQALDERLAEDAELREHFLRWLDAQDASPAQAGELAGSEPDGDRVAQGGARARRIATAAAVAAALLLSAAGLLLPRVAHERRLVSVREELCAVVLERWTAPVDSGLGCGAQRDVLLGAASDPRLAPLRRRLDADPAFHDPRWLQLRATVALLEGQPDEVRGLLAAGTGGTAAALEREPRLRLPLAATYWLNGDRDAASAELERAVEAAPGDSAIRQSAERLGAGPPPQRN